METYIYIINDGDNNVKIGKSNNPSKRVKTLQTGNPKSLEIVATFPVSKEKVFTVEKKCHHKLNTIYEKRGEWFRSVLLWEVERIVESIVEDYRVSPS